MEQKDTTAGESAESWRVRRAQRRDFAGVAELCSRLGVGVLGTDRRTIRRFRRIVADLGNDLYLAEVGESLCGLVHIVYARELLGPPRAEVALLLADDPTGTGEVRARLLACALQRARKRQCSRVVLRIGSVPTDLADLLQREGFHCGGEWYARDLAVEPQAQVQERETDA